MPIRNIHTGDKTCLKYLAYLEDGRMVRIYNAIFFYFNGTLATDTSEVDRLSYIITRPYPCSTGDQWVSHGQCPVSGLQCVH